MVCPRTRQANVMATKCIDSNSGHNYMRQNICAVTLLSGEVDGLQVHSKQFRLASRTDITRVPEGAQCHERSCFFPSMRSCFGSGIVPLQEQNLYSTAYIVMAYIVIAYIVTAYIRMAYIVTAYKVMAYIVTAYIRMAYIVTAYGLYTYGLCSYDLYSYGLYSYDLRQGLYPYRDRTLMAYIGITYIVKAYIITAVVVIVLGRDRTLTGTRSRGFWGVRDSSRCLAWYAQHACAGTGQRGRPRLYIHVPAHVHTHVHTHVCTHVCSMHAHAHVYMHVHTHVST